jgi:hypothetical protein
MGINPNQNNEFDPKGYYLCTEFDTPISDCTDCPQFTQCSEEDNAVFPKEEMPLSRLNFGEKLKRIAGNVLSKTIFRYWDPIKIDGMSLIRIEDETPISTL